MSTTDPTQPRDTASRPVARAGAVRRRATETKAAFKTTEFIAYVTVLAGILLAALFVDSDGDGDVGFGPKTAWLLVTLLTIGYMVSRGLAKSGSHDPYTDD